MELRRRIAAIALFGVQLLQGVLPAAGAACEPTAAVVASVTATTSAPHHHGQPAEHPHAPAACPMAMACAVAGVMSEAVAVSTVEVTIDVHRPRHVTAWPASLDVAPEPPPPRG